MKSKLAIFDLDGTLFDTSEVNYYAYKDAVAPYGVDIDKDYFTKECNGRHYTEFLPQIMGTSQYIKSVHKAKKDTYRANLDKARMNQGLIDIINGLISTGDYHTAIVTTASKQNAEDILSYFSCRNLFEYLVTQEDIIKVKPDPEGFLLAMDYFNITADKTIIFEDSLVGIEAAKKTNATVFTVISF